MSENRESISLAEIYDFRSGLSKPRSAFGSGFPFLSFKDVFYNSAVPSDLVELVETTEKEQNNSSVQRGDVFLTRTSETIDELGMSSVALKDIPNATFNGFCKRLRPKIDTKIVPEYSRYYFRSNRFRDQINSMATMSTRASLNNEMLERLVIDIPSLPDQTAIGYILGSLDDKIQINQRMNHSLEEIAKAIFQLWFVDFVPVRAKAEGRPTGLSPEISDLFSDELVDSEIGEIPKGWEPSMLSNFISEVGESIKPSPETEKAPYVPIDCISSKSLTLWHYKGGEEAKSSLVHFKKGDILFGAMRPYFHKVCIAPFDGTTRSTCLVLNSKLKDYFGFSLLTLFLDSTIDFASQNSTGSTIPYIKWKNGLDCLTIARPPLKLAAEFNRLLEPILEKFSFAIEEQKVLTELRDTLLPKLISGELRIPDAEKFLEEAGV